MFLCGLKYSKDAVSLPPGSFSSCPLLPKAPPKKKTNRSPAQAIFADLGRQTTFESCVPDHRAPFIGIPCGHRAPSSELRAPLDGIDGSARLIGLPEDSPKFLEAKKRMQRHNPRLALDAAGGT